MLGLVCLAPISRQLAHKDPFPAERRAWLDLVALPRPITPG